MNMMLHGIGGDELPLVVADSLAGDPGDRYEIVMTNPSFGKKSSTTIVADDGKVARETEIIERDDFWATTSNKQLNFLQHVKTLLKQNGRAAIVVPDNVLFEGGGRRDGAPKATARMRSSHPSASSDRLVLCSRCQSECPFLRQEARQ